MVVVSQNMSTAGNVEIRSICLVWKHVAEVTDLDYADVQLYPMKRYLEDQHAVYARHTDRCMKNRYLPLAV